MMNFRSKTTLAICCAAALSTLSWSTAADDDDDYDEKSWGEWTALASGYVARRREPGLKRVKEKLANRSQQTVTSEQAATEPALRSVASLDTASEINAAAVVGGERGTPRAAWVDTVGEGLYRVAIDDLVAPLGRNRASIISRVEAGALWIQRGKKATSQTASYPVSWRYDPGSEPGNESIIFAAQVFDTLYTTENAYRIRIGNASSSRAQPMDEASGDPGLPGVAEPYVEVLSFEEEPDWNLDLLTIADEPDADYWFWDYIQTPHPTKETFTVELDIPDAVLDPGLYAKVRITLRGGTDMEEGNDHEVTATLNGYPFEPEEWDGLNEAVLEGEVPQDLLYDPVDGTVPLVVFAGPNNTEYAAQYINRIEVEYLRHPVAQDDKLALKAEASGPQLVSGFTTQDIVVIEDPHGVASILADALIDGAGSDWSVDFEAVAGRDYLVSTMAVATVAEPRPDYPSKLRNKNNSADYLVIAHPDFPNTAIGIANYRAPAFGNMMIAWMDDVYDEYSAGRRDPAALARFMKRTQKNWVSGPGHVLLVGKGTYDEKRRMQWRDSYVPILFTANPWGASASDTKLLGYEDNPPFAIGRLPIVLDSEGEGYLAKLQRYDDNDDIEYDLDTGEPLGPTAVMVADNPDEGGNFPDSSDELVAVLNGLDFSSVRELYHEPPGKPKETVQTELRKDETWNVDLVNYTGHGNVDLMGSFYEQYIPQSRAEALKHGVYPIFTALTCAIGNDVIPTVRSLAGSLVLNADGGAVAALAPTGYSLNGEATVLGEVFFDGVFGEGDTMGQAANQARSANTSADTAFMGRMYNVIGEPGVRSY